MSNSLWVQAVRTGLAANKPTVPDVPESTFVFYYETDTTLMKMWNGSAWVEAGAITSLPEYTASTDVAVSADAPVAVRKVTLALTDTVLPVTEALDYGSVELVTLPDKNLIVFGCEVDLSIVKGDAVNGIGAATDLDVSLGTAAASATTLATTMLNILPKQDVDTDAVTVTVQAHSLAATPVLTGVLDGASNKIYLNAVPIGGITADDTLTVSGTVDLYVIDVGNRTS
jgi:hypothetical protein